MLAECSALLVVGSSVAVMSSYKIVLEALSAGKPVAVVNGGPGRCRCEGYLPVAYRRGRGRWNSCSTPLMFKVAEVLGSAVSIVNAVSPANITARATTKG